MIPLKKPKHTKERVMMMSMRDEIRKSFEGLSQSEIIKKLQDAGFNVKAGTGEIIIREK